MFILTKDHRDQPFLSLREATEATDDKNKKARPSGPGEFGCGGQI